MDESDHGSLKTTWTKSITARFLKEWDESDRCSHFESHQQLILEIHQPCETKRLPAASSPWLPAASFPFGFSSTPGER